MNWKKIEAAIIGIIIGAGLPLGVYLVVWDILRHMK